MDFNHHHSLTARAYPIEGLDVASSSSMSWSSQSPFVYQSAGASQSSAMVPPLTVCPSDLLKPTSPNDFEPLYSNGFLESETTNTFQTDFVLPYSIEPAPESRIRRPIAATSLSGQNYPIESRPEPFIQSPAGGGRIPCLVGGCKSTFANTKNRVRHMRHIQHPTVPRGHDFWWHCTICRPSKKLTRRDGYRRHGLSVHLENQWSEWLDEYCWKIQAGKHRDVTEDRQDLEREREQKLLRQFGQRST